METLVHELAHIDVENREAEQAKTENRMRKQVSHGPKFWIANDIAFQAAYPDAFPHVGPRLSNYHGRYTAALRAAAGLTEHEAKKGITPLTPKLRERVPGVYVWEERPAAASTPPLIEVPPPNTPLKGTALTDDKVRLLIKAWPGCTREQLEGLYTKTYGPYPGKSVYNSLWRLRRDGKVHRAGHSWHVC